MVSLLSWVGLNSRYIVVLAPTYSCEYFKSIKSVFTSVLLSCIPRLTQICTVSKLELSVYLDLTALDSVTYIKLYMFQAKSVLPLVNCVSCNPSYYSYGKMVLHVFVKQYLCFVFPVQITVKKSSYSMCCTPLVEQPLHLFPLAA